VFWPIVSQITPATFDFREGPKKLHAPVLVIHGKRDRRSGTLSVARRPEQVYKLRGEFLRSVQ
jgi:pimeloyl-ACP methyl ester carboxylesterase